MFTQEDKQSLFEKFFTKKYEWEIQRNRRGYSLLRAPVGDDRKYLWDRAEHEWYVWLGGFEMACEMFNKGEV